MPSCCEIFNDTLIVTRIIHVLTQASLSRSLVRAASKGKALSKGSGTVYKDLFRFWDGYFLSPGEHGRELDKYFSRIYSTGVDIPMLRGPIRLVGIVELQDLFTWPCLLCARVIHFFLLGCTSRRVVDRAAPNSVVFYNELNFDLDNRPN